MLNSLSVVEDLNGYVSSCVREHQGPQFIEHADLNLVVLYRFPHLDEELLETVAKCFVALVVEQDLPVTEPGLDSLLKRVNDVNFHTGGNEHELDLTVLQHVKYLIEQHLLGLG